jgi:hypothetical protein
MARGAVPAARVAAAMALLLAATGCAGGDQSPSATPAPATGPAEAYLEAALGFTADDVAAAALRAEELIAACMAKEGFEYVPDVSGYGLTDLSEVEPPPGTREFAAQFGYGFAALPEGMVTRGPAQGANPNDAITAAMSEEEHETYTRALFGDVALEGADESGGCFEEARAQVWGDRETDPVRTALEDEIARIDAEVAPQDPAVVEAAAAWSACMADAGFPGFANPPQAEQAAWDRWVAFNEGLAADAAGGTGAAGAPTDDGAPAGQADLAAAEVALATADWDCREESDYDAVWREVRSRLQQEYVDAHRDELDAWVEAHA